MKQPLADSVAPLYLKLEVIAADVPPSFAVRHMCRVADRIGIMVEAEVNGISVNVWPDTNEDRMAEQYDEAVRRKVKWVGSNAIPAAAS